MNKYRLTATVEWHDNPMDEYKTHREKHAMVQCYQDLADRDHSATNEETEAFHCINASILSWMKYNKSIRNNNTR